MSRPATVICEICGDAILSVDLDGLAVPMTGGMFECLPNLEFNWHPSVEWEYMRCPWCSKRPFGGGDGWNEDRGSLTVKEGEGRAFKYVIPSNIVVDESLPDGSIHTQTIGEPDLIYEGTEPQRLTTISEFANMPTTVGTFTGIAALDDVERDEEGRPVKAVVEHICGGCGYKAKSLAGLRAHERACGGAV